MKRSVPTLTALTLARRWRCSRSRPACKKKAPTTTAGRAAPGELHARPRRTVAPPPSAGAAQATSTAEVLSHGHRRRSTRRATSRTRSSTTTSPICARTRARRWRPTREWLKKYPTVQVLIEGHCDERGTAAYNLALGDRRANAAKDYLGLARHRRLARCARCPTAKERPFCTESNESCWQQNRRAHLVITAK